MTIRFTPAATGLVALAAGFATLLPAQSESSRPAPQDPARQDGPTRSLERFLRELAPHYDIGSLFRFEPPHAPSKEPIYNQPEAFGFEIERRIEALPRQGRSKQVPWSGWWWPMSRDGIAAGGENSPIARYARAVGLGAEPVTWEREHHGTAGERTPESWWGHCNGWAAAAILEPAPRQPVELGGEMLSASDIAALLTEVYYGCRAIGLDERYAGDDTPPVDEFGRAEDRAYRDVNPAVLHLLACNRIGNEGRAMVADISPGSQVWNHPLWAYEITELNPLADGAAAVRWITGQGSHAGAYPFNDAAARWYAVKARFRIAVGLRGPGTPESADGAGRSTWLEYEYVLETDADGRILGGEWAGASRKEHPDFVWVPLTPSSSYTVTPDGRYVVGTTGLGNPFVVYEDVRELLRQSVGEPLANDVAVDEGPGRWQRPGGAAEPRWTRVLQLAQCQIQAGQVEQAIATLQAPLQEPAAAAQVPEPVRQELQIQAGWLQFVAGQPQQALATYAQLPTEGDLGPVVLARRALFLVARGEQIRALADAARAIQANPRNPWGYLARAWVYLSRDAEFDAERAVADLEVATELGTDPFLAFTGLQVQLQQSGGSAAQAQASGPQQEQRQRVEHLRAVFQARLDSLPSTLQRLFVGQVTGVQRQTSQQHDNPQRDK